MSAHNGERPTPRDAELEPIGPETKSSAYWSAAGLALASMGVIVRDGLWRRREQLLIACIRDQDRDLSRLREQMRDRPADPSLVAERDDALDRTEKLGVEVGRLEHIIKNQQATIEQRDRTIEQLRNAQRGNSPE